MGSSVDAKRLASFALALAIGTCGALLFLYLRMPLAWMLGSMFACTVAALLRVPIRAFDQTRPLMTAIIGVLLGAGFSPALISDLGSWVPTLAGLAVFVVFAAIIGTVYYRVVGKLDLPTAFFCAMPGGLVEMTTLGHEKGGDARLIALAHSCRILLVVALLPVLLQFLVGIKIPANTSTGAGFMETPIASDIALLLCVGIGMVIGQVLKLPARYLLGPMLVSGAAHLTGLTEFHPPRELVIVAQLFLGTLVGCRFAGMPIGIVFRALALSVGATMILLLLTVAAAGFLAAFSSHPMMEIILAYSPGGLTEMSLVAVAIQADVAFVSTHHIARVVLVLFTATLLFRLVQEK